MKLCGWKYSNFIIIIDVGIRCALQYKLCAPTITIDYWCAQKKVLKKVSYWTDADNINASYRLNG